MNNKSTFLSVVIPVYNEQSTVSKLISQVLKHLPPRSEIVIVNDGSTDNTAKILEKFKLNRRIRIFNLPQNKGKGYATRYGYQQARGEVMLIQDADLEYHPKYYQRLLEPIKAKKAQAVYGSRLSTTPLTLHNLLNIPLPLHFLANKFLSWFCNLLYGSKLTDMETCYKVFTRQVYRRMNLKKNGFCIDPEITAQILNSGFSITEVPITTIPRNYSDGKKITWKDGFRTTWTLIEYRFGWFHLKALIILGLATFFRFYDFTHRYGLWSDQARDVIVGRFSIVNRTLPLIGSFSSAGPFTFGPYWYWYAALMDFIFGHHYGYWIGMGIASVIMVAVLMWIAHKLAGSFMALTAGLLSATSVGLVESSLGSTQHSAVGVVVTIVLALLTSYAHNRQLRYLILAVFALGVAVNFHYQAIYLVPMMALAVLMLWPGLKALPVLALAWFIPFIPMLIFDLQHRWWNISKIIDYYRFGQHRIYVPNRWLTYALDFWPGMWSRTLGFFQTSAYPLMAGIGLLYLYQLLKSKLNKTLLIYGFGFLIAIVWFRYFKAERNHGYVVYAQPFIILFTSWLIATIRTKSIPLSALTMGVLLTGNLYGHYLAAGNFNINTPLNHLISSLTIFKPQSTFAVYDRQFYSTGCSISLSLLLDDRSLAESDGYPIGVCDGGMCPSEYPLIATSQVGSHDCRLVDLSTADPDTLTSQQWVLVSPSEVHRMTVEWWRTEPSLQ